MKYFNVLSLFLVLVGNNGHAQVPAQSPSNQDVAAPVQKSPTTQPVLYEVRLRVPGARLSLDKTNNRLYYCDNCRVKTAHQKYYHFDAEHFAAVVGPDYKTKVFELTAQVHEEIRSRSKPNPDPRVSQPSGGFTSSKYICSVKEVHESKPYRH